MPLRLFWRIFWDSICLGLLVFCFVLFVLFWIVAMIINLHLHKASIFVHSHVDKGVNNLKYIPFKVHLEQIENVRLIAIDNHVINYN